MSVESTKKAMTRYVESQHADLSMMADGVVFTNMTTGEEHTGQDAVRGMLHHIYHVAFDAKAELKNAIYADEQAALEFDFVGTHIGEFAGVPATGRAVRAPLCVTYDLEDGAVVRGRVYFQVPVLLAQLAG